MNHAAIDIGTNSIHLLVASVGGDASFEVLTSEKETVRLGDGPGEIRALSPAAIDRGIALYFPKPHSFTGEHVLELQGHGGPVVLDMLVNRVLELGARLARPGEFSESAFLNGKLDLAQAEAGHPQTVHSERPTWARHYVLAGLCAAAIIAYIGRNCLGVAEGAIRSEFDIPLLQMGWLMGTFFWSYALAQIPGNQRIHHRGQTFAQR